MIRSYRLLNSATALQWRCAIMLWIYLQYKRDLEQFFLTVVNDSRGKYREGAD